MKLKMSSKRLQINKDQSALLAVVATATVLTVFFLVSTKVLFEQASYQRKLINARQVAEAQLKKNLQSANDLVEYHDQVFNAGQTNVLGGKNDSSSEAQPPNGTNSRIVLNALPSTYDFPALITSVTKILSTHGITSAFPQGVDETATVSSEPSDAPQPTLIELNIGGQLSFNSTKLLLNDLERSIRPFDVNNLQIRGSESNMTINIRLNTYFQPAKKISIGSKDIK